MNYSNRYRELNSYFCLGQDVQLPETKCIIRFFSFKSNGNNYQSTQDTDHVFSDKVSENTSFVYPVFVPKGVVKSDKAILLMHGLNERNWSKYLTWAEFLCNATGKIVILFPIAYHVNRSPEAWSNPRNLQLIYESRKIRNGVDRSLSFANVALSERITQNPHRFYSSGRQTVSDITQLVGQIKSGLHPLFYSGAHVDFFAYSIGAFLSQITFMANPFGFFEDSKLFMFCGGSIFSSMFGQSRTIMDKVAFDTLLKYYKEEFSDKNERPEFLDDIFDSFNSMISPERSELGRMDFFNKMANRLAGVSLQKDVVIPYEGITKALGEGNTRNYIDLVDFDFDYSHENPFPVGLKSDSVLINNSFDYVFSKAAAFLS